MTQDERIDQLRTAVADYIWSEGCSCCQNKDAHDAARKRLGELLLIEPDNEGWHSFLPYRSAQRT